MQLSIASFLDTNATAEIRKLQTKLSNITGSEASLLSWSPHITIADGVSVSESQFIHLQENLSKLTGGIKRLHITMTGFSFSDSRKGEENEVTTPYVLRLNVQLNEQLAAIVDALALETTKYPLWYKRPKPYAPHITLAFRDLSKEGFENGKRFLKGRHVNLRSVIDHIALVEKLESKDIERIRFKLSTRIK